MLSKTLVVTEGVDRGVAGTDTESQIGNSRWSCGTNCFLHNSRVVNTPDVDGFRSNHLGGVNALFADGRVLFLVDDVAPDVVLAMCTKDGREAVSAERFPMMCRSIRTLVAEAGLASVFPWKLGYAQIAWPVLVQAADLGDDRRGKPRAVRKPGGPQAQGGLAATRGDMG